MNSPRFRSKKPGCGFGRMGGVVAGMSRTPIAIVLALTLAALAPGSAMAQMSGLQPVGPSPQQFTPSTAPRATSPGSSLVPPADIPNVPSTPAAPTAIPVAPSQPVPLPPTQAAPATCADISVVRASMGLHGIMNKRLRTQLTTTDVPVLHVVCAADLLG